MYTYINSQYQKREEESLHISVFKDETHNCYKQVSLDKTKLTSEEVQLLKDYEVLIESKTRQQLADIINS